MTEGTNPTTRRSRDADGHERQFVSLGREAPDGVIPIIMIFVGCLAFVGALIGLVDGSLRLDRPGIGRFVIGAALLAPVGYLVRWVSLGFATWNACVLTASSLKYFRHVGRRRPSTLGDYASRSEVIDLAEGSTVQFLLDPSHGSSDPSKPKADRFSFAFEEMRVLSGDKSHLIVSASQAGEFGTCHAGPHESIMFSDAILQKAREDSDDHSVTRLATALNGAWPGSVEIRVIPCFDRGAGSIKTATRGAYFGVAGSLMGQIDVYLANKEHARVFRASRETGAAKALHEIANMNGWQLTWADSDRA